jgi:hypothetical protein
MMTIKIFIEFYFATICTSNQFKKDGSFEFYYTSFYFLIACI